jgi:hypothetical protein
MWQSYTRYPLRDPVIRDIPVSPTDGYDKNITCKDPLSGEKVWLKQQ